MIDTTAPAVGVMETALGSLIPPMTTTAEDLRALVDHLAPDALGADTASRLAQIVSTVGDFLKSAGSLLQDAIRDGLPAHSAEPFEAALGRIGEAWERLVSLAEAARCQ